MRCSILGLWVVLFAGCGGPSAPDVPVGLHGPFLGQLEIVQVLGDDGWIAREAASVSPAQSKTLTFAFRLPPEHEQSPIAFEVHAEDVAGIDEGPCGLGFHALQRPPKWPALGVGTVDVGLLPHSRCKAADRDELRPGRYEARVTVAGTTVATRGLTVDSP
jgi:hypothetical protein